MTEIMLMIDFRTKVDVLCGEHRCRSGMVMIEQATIDVPWVPSSGDDIHFSDDEDFTDVVVERVQLSIEGTAPRVVVWAVWLWTYSSAPTVEGLAEVRDWVAGMIAKAGGAVRPSGASAATPAP